MQTSKNHFEAKVIFNDETIRRMFRTEFYTYMKISRRHSSFRSWQLQALPLCSPLAAALPTTLQQAALLLPARQLLQAAAST